MQPPAPEPTVVRCAVYTRKSTNEGLDSDFSSIDNQREACEACIRSQQAEGWRQVEEAFDDGGFSGGTVDRPALKRLLSHIEAGEIDCVVVYKIDRLSRSLLDFVRLLEMFEAHHVSFVAVTQQINTSTSAGRLMLHVLVSFAEFERSIGSERTREKIQAARKKGRYTGGRAPLGYDVDREKHALIINQDEAKIVRDLFRLYLELGSLINVVKEAKVRGWMRKVYTTAKGVKLGGNPFDKVTLYRTLTNPLYLGLVQLNGDLYPGLHEAIVDDETFDQVQRRLEENQNGAQPGPESRNKHNALLRGPIKCGVCGKAMSHSFSKKRKRMYRYYVCTTAVKQGRAACPTPSLAASDIEAFVVEKIRGVARDPELVRQVFQEATEMHAAQIERLKSERQFLQKQKVQRDEDVKRTAAALSAMDAQPDAMLERLAEIQTQTTTLVTRIAEIDTELASLSRIDVNLDQVAATLAEFNVVWDLLHVREQCRLVQLLVERIVYQPDGEIAITFRCNNPSKLGDLGSPNPRCSDGNSEEPRLSVE